MIIDITEEEQEFLIRICIRGLALANLNSQLNPDDPKKMIDILKKLKGDE